MRTSYSALETFLQCPQKYKFQEIDRIKTPKSAEAIFGSLIHHSLKFMFSRDPLFPTLDEVLAHFRENWPSREVFEAEAKNDPRKRIWTPEEEKIYLTEGVKMLKKFYEKNAPWNFNVLDLESRFEAVLADDRTGQIHILAGIIDRIDKLADGEYEIIDYKTAKRMPSQDSLANNFQLSLYSLGIQKRWPHLGADNIKLSLYFLKHGEKLSAKIPAEAVQKTKAKILNIVSEIQEHLRSGREFEPMPSALCNWCAYRPICPAWRHLYQNQEPKIKNQKEIEGIIKEYFEIKKTEQQNKTRLYELQNQIKNFMEKEGLTRVFGGEGYISKRKVQRYEYDFPKIKAVLSPLGKWEEILKADEKKLNKILGEIPEETRLAVENCRKVSKEYFILTAAAKKFETQPPTPSESKEI